MDSTRDLKRRDFLKAWMVAGAFIIVPRHVLGGKGYVAPSDKITMGLIGCGKQGGGLARLFQENGAQLVGAADVFREKREATAKRINKKYAELAGKTAYESCQTYEDFRELLDKKDIDAVIIALPDHWHAAAAVRAARAGKDIYCEKPLSLTVQEGRAMVDATRQHNRVFQTGNMERSWPEFRQAVQLVRSGAIGEIQRVFVSVGGPPKPWDLSAEAVPEGLDWKMWLGPNTTDRPYNNVLAPGLVADFWPKWRDYADFGGGGMTDWGAHMFDIAQWGLGMDDSGPTELIFPDFKDSDDYVQDGLVYKYANGIEMIHKFAPPTLGCRFVGSEGEIRVSRGELTTTPASLKDKHFKAEDYQIYVSKNHFTDFLESIKTRKQPICDVETGHRTATVCNIGNIAYRLKKSLRWDPVKEGFLNDREANALLKRPMKKKWRV